MTLLLESAVKIGIVLLVALGVSALLRRQSAAARHWVLAAGIACAGATPMLGVVVPAWHLPWAAPSPPSVTRPATETITLHLEPSADARPLVRAALTGPKAGRPFGVPDLLASIWMLGTAVSLGTLVSGLARLGALSARSREAGDRWAAQAAEISSAYGLRRPVRLLETDHPFLLVTWGLRPRIMLPLGCGSWTPDRIRIVVGHELAHLQRGDWIVQMMAELLRSVYWFNPLVWIACRRLRLESEHACDDRVLSLGVDRADYAAHLVDLARASNAHGRTWLPAPAIARSSTLRKRVSAMLNHDVNRRPLTTSARLAAVGGLLAVTLPIAGLVAQVFGSVTGTVTDPFGGLIPNVTLTLSHAGSTARHEVRSDQTGAFQFVGLRPGDYRLEARVPGFADLTRELTLTAGQTLPLPLTLQIGSVQETITVRGGPNDAERPSRQAVSRRSAQGEPCSPSPVGGRIVPPRKIVDVRPQYPASLRGATTESRVALEARIGTDGSVTDLRTVSAPDVDVESAASTAVSQWLFTPTLLNCVPVDVKMTVTVSFKPQ